MWWKRHRSLVAAGAVFALVAPSIAGPAPAPVPYKRGDDDSSELVSQQILASPFPYFFPQLQSGDAATSGQFPMPLCHGFKLEEATIDQLQKAMKDGVLTSAKIVRCYLERIHQTDAFLK
jgi:amidase